MSIDNLRSALPSYAKDMNLNLSSLPRITSLTEQQLWGAILATAAATKVDSVVVEIAKKTLYTGHIGDGKIFVYDVAQVVLVACIK